MKPHAARLTVLLLGVLLSLRLAAAPAVRAAEGLALRQWTVAGVKREALVHAPPKTGDGMAPVVFVFHGHGGSMNNAARSFHLHRLWPEAIVVYPQGLNTPGRLTDPEGKKPGWQPAAGEQGDRDLKFFDAMLTSLKQDHRVDEKRIYATGHSNGGGFTYLLWAARGEVFAALAPSASAAGVRVQAQLKPKPVLHIAGEQDPLVRFAWQQATMEALRQLNQCGEGKPDGQWCTRYESRTGNPVVTCIHPGQHQFIPEAPALIVQFFKQHAKP